MISMNKEEVIEALAQKLAENIGEKLIDGEITNKDILNAVYDLEWTGECRDVDFYSLDSNDPYSPKLNTFKSWMNKPYEIGDNK